MDYLPENWVAGVLAPIFCLRGRNDLGIGDTGALGELVEWAAENGFGAVQILPVNESGGDFSPYNLRSAMALDPLTVDTVPGRQPGLRKDIFDRIVGRYDLGYLREGGVKYREVARLKTELLRAGFDGLKAAEAREFEAFRSENGGWIEDYGIYRALVDWNGGEEDFGKWPDEHRSPDGARKWLDGLSGMRRREFLYCVRFWIYCQWVAYSQWKELREKADRMGVALIGDVPVGVSIWSADVWASPHLFDLSRRSGAPPEKVFDADPFTKQWGQNWGFPLYRWREMARDNFAWWRRRFRLMRQIFPLLRVDHALGFFRIYSFPWPPSENERFVGLTAEQAAALTGGELPRFVERDDSTEENREFNRQHGEHILRMFLEETGSHRILAEDLGEVAPYVRPTLAALGIAGFKIPQWEVEGGRFVPGGSYERLSVATFATHDHPPIRVIWEELFERARSGDEVAREEAVAEMRKYLEFCGVRGVELPCGYTREVHFGFLRGLFACNSWLAVHMVTDLFGLRERFNVPGSAAADNWTTRIPESVGRWNETYKDIILEIRKIISDTGRKNPTRGLYKIN